MIESWFLLFSQTVEMNFMSSIKEADFIKHGGKIISTMQKKDHLQLWQGLQNGKSTKSFPILLWGVLFILNACRLINELSRAPMMSLLFTKIYKWSWEHSWELKVDSSSEKVRF